jgi:hypothetical protein
MTMSNHRDCEQPMSANTYEIPVGENVRPLSSTGVKSHRGRIAAGNESSEIVITGRMTANAYCKPIQGASLH